MAVQARQNNTNFPFILSGTSYVREAETFAQDAGRATALAPYTVVAQVASTRQWVPLTDVDPAFTAGRMVCGAIGGTQAAFAAVSDGSFGISVDGETAFQVAALDFTDLPSVLDTKGRMTCGAVGTGQAGFAAVSDGSFQLSVDGTAISITGLDFSDIPSTLDTRATGVCGANGTNLAGWQAIVDGSLTVTVNGNAEVVTGVNFSAISDLEGVAHQLNEAYAGSVVFEYDSNADVYMYYSPAVGAVSTLSALSTGGAGTDISAAGFLNGQTGTVTLVQGVGHDGYYSSIADVINVAARGRFFCLFDGDEFVFVSPTEGTGSTVTVLTAGAGGTDISGAGYLNGLTGTGTAVAGTGTDEYNAQIADVINNALAAAGRGVRCTFDGDECVFISQTLGINSAVSVLTAGTSGTDISGAGFLNGLTGTGTATAGSGGTGENIPTGIYMGGSITAAELVAGTVVNRPVLVGGCCTVDEDQIVLEGSLTLNSVVNATMQTIRAQLASRGIFAENVIITTNLEN